VGDTAAQEDHAPGHDISTHDAANDTRKYRRPHRMLQKAVIVKRPEEVHIPSPFCEMQI
jgi:hypothetical protein